MNKITTLVPLSEFVSKIDKICPRETDQMYDLWKLHQLGLITRYNKFLLQPLELGFFVPCDDENNVLDQPQWKDCKGERDYQRKMEFFTKLKSKILFEGFEWNKQGYAAKNLILKKKCAFHYMKA